MGDAGREEPIIGLLSRGVSVAGAAAWEGPTAKGARREMAPQRLEKVESAPGNGMAPAARTPNIWYGGHAARGPRPSSRRIPVASRRMAEATSDTRRMSRRRRRKAPGKGSGLKTEDAAKLLFFLD